MRVQITNVTKLKLGIVRYVNVETNSPNNLFWVLVLILQMFGSLFISVLTRGKNVY